MASTIIGSGLSHNTYISSGTSGTFVGDAATGLRTRYIADWVRALAPYTTPLLSSLEVSSPATTFFHEWGQSYQLPHTSALAEALDTSETGVDVTTGHGVRFQVYSVIRVPEDASGNAAEIMWVQSIGTDTLTVVRAQGGTTAVAHDSGTTVEHIGVAEPHNVDHPRGSIIYGDTAGNYPQRFATSLQFDEFARWEPNLEFGDGDQLVKQISRKMKDLKLLVEKALFVGGRQAGQADVSAKLPSMFGGLDFFLTTNVTDVGGDPLSIYHIEEELASIWDTAGENMPRVILMSHNTKRILNRLLDATRGTGTGLGDTKLNLTWESVSFETGTYFLGVSRRCPDGDIYLVDLDMLRWVPYKNQDWQTVELPVAGAHEIRAVRGAFTFEVKGEASMARITDFDTTLANYSSPFA
jgi:hypothetical protein